MLPLLWPRTVAIFFFSRGSPLLPLPHPLPTATRPTSRYVSPHQPPTKMMSIPMSSKQRKPCSPSSSSPPPPGRSSARGGGGGTLAGGAVHLVRGEGRGAGAVGAARAAAGTTWGGHCARTQLVTHSAPRMLRSPRGAPPRASPAARSSASRTCGRCAGSGVAARLAAAQASRSTRWLWALVGGGGARGWMRLRSLMVRCAGGGALRSAEASVPGGAAVGRCCSVCGRRSSICSGRRCSVFERGAA